MAWNFPFFGRYNATPPTLTDTQTSPAQLDVNGNVIVSGIGTDPTNLSTALPAGATGVRGFLGAIWNKLNGLMKHSLWDSTGANAASINALGELSVRNNDTSTTVTLGAANAFGILAANGQHSAVATVDGDLVGTLTFQGSNDYNPAGAAGNGNWHNALVAMGGQSAPAQSVWTLALNSGNSNTAFRILIGGYKYIRIQVTAYTGGTSTCIVNGGGVGPTFIMSSLPAGSAIIGQAGIDQTTKDVGGTNAVSATGKVVSSADATQANSTQLQQRMDGHGRLRVANNNAVDPWQTYIERYGSISTGATTDTALTNANSAGGNYPANSITYTVAAGSTFYLKKMVFSMEPNIQEAGVFAVAIGGVKKIFVPMRLASGGNSPAIVTFEMKWDEGMPIAAGTTITVYFRTIGGGTITAFVRFEGKEEVN